MLLLIRSIWYQWMYINLSLTYVLCLFLSFFYTHILSLSLLLCHLDSQHYMRTKARHVKLISREDRRQVGHLTYYVLSSVWVIVATDALLPCEEICIVACGWKTEPCPMFFFRVALKHYH